MKVLIVGGGDIGLDLAQNLIRRAHDNQVTVIEADAQRAEELAEQLDALVLHGDGTHPEVLRNAQVEAADAVVATTGSDAHNTVVAMLAKRLGVDTIVVRVEDVGLRAACEEIGAIHVVAPRRSAAAEMTSCLYGFHRLDFSLVSRGGLGLTQITARRVADRRVADLDLPQGSLIVAVMRSPTDVIVPHGEIVLDASDELIVLTAGDEVAERVRALLAPAD